ncbi:uncharacterized protein EI97DRAFT_501147 [Westerdykella ornata]|uniref:Uncharacterized protein n=1 Tax=Westerdykella ornata TaxID=318751 RepID=A0A6A6JJE4_WESOR|nr:uncharacterized protein EI97DRAFT_501147 [Westerdykella ornata]KAF2276365.1 hypothetical protein EI97DRAFT_501147 [Westerdykella ornata]
MGLRRERGGTIDMRGANGIGGPEGFDERGAPGEYIDIGVSEYIDIQGVYVVITDDIQGVSCSTLLNGSPLVGRVWLISALSAQDARTYAGGSGGAELKNLACCCRCWWPKIENGVCNSKMRRVDRLMLLVTLSSASCGVLGGLSLSIRYENQNKTEQGHLMPPTKKECRLRSKNAAGQIVAPRMREARAS